MFFSSLSLPVFLALEVKLEFSEQRIDRDRKKAADEALNLSREA